MQKEILIFRRDELYFGLDKSFVEDVILLPQLKKLSWCQPFLLGLFFFQSEQVLLLDIKGFLQISKVTFEEDKESYLVVIIKNKGNLLGILADETFDFAVFAEEEIEQALLALPSSLGKYIEGFVDIEEKSVILINLAFLFEKQEVTLSVEEEVSDEESEESLKERAELLGKRGTGKKEISVKNRKFIVFSVDGNMYALEPSCVKEIVFKGNIVPVPHTPSFICGLVNLRGDVVAVVDLLDFLGAGQSAGDFVLIVSVCGVDFGIICQGGAEIVEVEEDLVESVPYTIEKAEYLQNIFKRSDSQMAAHLDLAKIINSQPFLKLRSLEVGKKDV